MSGVVLYPYQQQALDAVSAEYDAGRDAALVVMPTGTGKSVLGAAVAERVVRAGGKVLVLAYRGELLDQWAKECNLFGLTWGVEKASQRAVRDSLFGRADVVLGSINTLKGQRLLDCPPRQFDLIIYDEAHHGTAPSSVRILDHFAHAKRLGLTATPERGDEDPITRVFGRLAFEYPLWQAVDDRWLVPPYFRRPPCKVDLSKIDGSGGDLNQGDLEDEISRHVEELANGLRAEIGGRTCMVFTPKVGSAQAMADGLRQVGVEARSVHGESEDRKAVVDQFLAREYQALCSCAMLLEGFDAPHVGALGMCRPTKSGIVYRQMLGRGLRRYAGDPDNGVPAKDVCLIVDFAWNSGRHDLFRPIDLFDTTGTDAEVLKIAEGLIESGRQPDGRKALAEADRIHRTRVATRVSVRERASKFRFLAFDPFAVGEVLGVPRRPAAAAEAPATPDQQRRLDRAFKTYEIDYSGVSRGYAAKLLAEMDDRRSRGLATHRQVASLIANGVDQDEARALPFDAASALLGDLLGSRR